LDTLTKQVEENFRLRYLLEVSEKKNQGLTSEIMRMCELNGRISEQIRIRDLQIRDMGEQIHIMGQQIREISELNRFKDLHIRDISATLLECQRNSAVVDRLLDPSPPSQVQPACEPVVKAVVVHVGVQVEEIQVEEIQADPEPEVQTPPVPEPVIQHQTEVEQEKMAVVTVEPAAEPAKTKKAHRKPKSSTPKAIKAEEEYVELDLEALNRFKQGQEEQSRQVEETRRQDKELQRQAQIQRQAKQEADKAATRKAKIQRQVRQDAEKAVAQVLDTMITSVVTSVEARKSQAATVIQAAIRRNLAKVALIGMQVEMCTDGLEYLLANLEKMVALQMPAPPVVVLEKKVRAPKQAKTKKPNKLLDPAKQALPVTPPKTVKYVFLNGGNGFPFADPLMSCGLLDLDDVPYATIKDLEALTAVCTKVFKQMTPVYAQFHAKFDRVVNFPHEEVLVQLKIQDSCCNAFLIERNGFNVAGAKLYRVRSHLPIEKAILSPSVSLTTIAEWFDDKALQLACRAVYPKGLPAYDLETLVEIQFRMMEAMNDLYPAECARLDACLIRDLDDHEYQKDTFGNAKMALILPGHTEETIASSVEIMDWIARGVI
jgi:hypothetical protein